MYDQVGFYSENGFPAQAGRAAGGGRPPRHPNMDFGGFDFSECSKRARRPKAEAAGRPAAAAPAAAAFKDIFSQFFGGRQAGHQPKRSRKRAPISNTA
jgi:DnaJ-class molecular chaperone